jgi:hypothetical protein
MDQYHLANVSLEISAKPFLRIDDESILGLMEDVFRHWYSLLKHADTIALLWWLSDGTDILVYNRDIDTPIQWMKYLGFAHKTFDVPREKDPYGESIVGVPRIYHPGAPALTYGDVRRIVRLMKYAAKNVLQRDLRVGTAFDPGAEFSNHPFRYEQHPELLLGETIKCIDCTARLHADNQGYAGFPDGIPEGTPFGTFLGRQMKAYLDDMGFDYIWFSNSFGYGRSPYAFGGAGQFFDGQRFKPDGNTEVRDRILEFWQLLRRECPEYPIETRGTDFTVGMNLVNHATPYQAIYNGNFNIVPPPNTPWPALTKNHGLALCGYLSRISAYRGNTLPMRFYATDPWWCNSPWRDMWERQPHDIYLSGAICRIGRNGEVNAFNDFKILSIDSSWGEVEEQIPDEVIPHVKRATALRPDAPPPVMWIYPFDEYHRWTFDDKRLAEVMAGDLLIQNAFNHGLPMSGVMTTSSLVTEISSHPGAYSGSVLVTPVPEPDSPWEEALLKHLQGGGNVLCYGTTEYAGQRWLDKLGIAHAAPIEGELALRMPHDPDVYREHAASSACHHDSILSGGGIREILATVSGKTEVLAAVVQGDDERIVALVRPSKISGAGTVAWVRGTSSVTVEGVKGRNLATHDPGTFYPCEILLRHALGVLGWENSVIRDNPSRQAVHLMVSRVRNGFVYAGYSPDPTAEFVLGSPLGAPLLPGRDLRIEDGRARTPIHGWFHEEVRVFVQQKSGVVGLHAISPKHYRYKRRWALNGLEQATIHFFPEAGCGENTQMLLNTDLGILVTGESFESEMINDRFGEHVRIDNVSGTLTFGWSENSLPLPVPVS